MGSTRAEGSSSINKSSHGNAIFWVDGKASMVHTELKTNSGNKKAAYRKFNDTYTLNNKGGAYELEGTLLGYKDSVDKRGDVLDVDFTGKQDKVTYQIYGHPDKFEYDYSSKYNDSGLVSALNILGIAGKVDIFENNDHYSEYLSTVIGTKTTDTLETVNIYPDAYNFAETEDQFLLDAIKNGFAISIKNPELYNSVDDLVFEDGGGTINLVNPEDNYPYEKGVEALCNILGHYDVPAHEQTLIIKGAEEVEEEKGEDGEEGSGGTTTEDTSKSELNKVKYDFCNELSEIVKEGKGLILIGNGYNLVNDEWVNGESIALNVVGVIEGMVDAPTEDNPDAKAHDICGFYVVETAGFLGSSGKAQFLTVDKLYDFLAGFDVKKGQVTATTMIVTDNEIKSWADNLNLTGNDGRNYLTGNDSDNILKGLGSSDLLYGNGGNDSLYGGDQGDTLNGGSGNDYLDGGSGNDTYVFLKKDGVCHDTVVLGSGEDTIMFEDAKDVWYGKDMQGNLIIHYKNGTQTEESTITVKDYFKKGLYNNLKNICFKKDFSAYKYLTDIQVAPGETKNFSKEVLNAPDTVIYNELDKNNPNKHTGSKFHDQITGGTKNDTIVGGDGNDTISGGSGNNIIKGGNGNDVIIASTGNDKIYGESGINEIHYDGLYGGNDTIYSGKGDDYIYIDRNKDDVNIQYAKSGKDLTILYDCKEDADGIAPKGTITITDYFKKQGQVSVKGINFADTYDNLKALYNQILSAVESTSKKLGNSKDTSAQTITGTVGNDTITGGKGNDTLSGGFGNDVIKGGNGDDVIIGGKGDDKMYGGSGNNTYIFNEYLSGQDVIYTSGNGKTTLDFSALDDVIFDGSGLKGRADDLSEYTLTKSGNDLILNYAQDNSSIDESKITISKFFKSKGEFEIINGDESKTNLKSMTLNIDGKVDKKNKITGTFMNDYIVGGKLNDTIKGGNGNDTIAGGLGNDNITGGAGNNTIIYNKGDGNDTINLTKGENLTIEMNGFNSKEDLSFNAAKNNLEISYKNGNKIEKIIIKNFIKKDVTTDSGSVNLKVGEETIDLRNDAYLPGYDNFTNKKTKYTGNWHSEVIDATKLDNYFIKKSKGANINGGAGNDTIYGSMYNDTIKGGEGDDVIYGNGGTDKLDGGNGSDTYYLFNGISENTIITDTGAAGTDIAVICDKLSNVENYKIYFNFDKDGNFNEISISGKGSVSMTGVEKLQLQDSEGNLYEFNTDSVKTDVAAWLTNNGGFANVSTAIDEGGNIKDLYEIFANQDNWTQVN